MSSERTGMTSENEIPISHLQRRKIEGRVLIPFIEACRRRFGEEATRALVADTIERIAATEGAAWAKTYGQGLVAMRRVAEEVWARGGVMDVEVLHASEDRLDFNVTRCGYAEFYRDLGLADLGILVQCCRDRAMASGFDATVEFTRTSTIMEGGTHCDFRFHRKSPS